MYYFLPGVRSPVTVIYNLRFIEKYIQRLFFSIVEIECRIQAVVFSSIVVLLIKLMCTETSFSKS